MNQQILTRSYPLVTGVAAPILRTVTQRLVAIDANMRKFCKELLILMKIYEGVGLAAPQVGKLLRIAAFTQRDYSKEKLKLLQKGVMINPEIIAQSEKWIIDEEGCLSLPGITGEVARPQRVTIRFQDPQGKTQILKATGYNARILLHEIDHLDGVLFIDKLVGK